MVNVDIYRVVALMYTSQESRGRKTRESVWKEYNVSKRIALSSDPSSQQHVNPVPVPLTLSWTGSCHRCPGQGEESGNWQGAQLSPVLLMDRVAPLVGWNKINQDYPSWWFASTVLEHVGRSWVFGSFMENPKPKPNWTGLQWVLRLTAQ